MSVVFWSALGKVTVSGVTTLSASAASEPASGSVFSLLPPDNATGNFTKVVQRLAVRIEVPATLRTQELLRPGMSVVVSVNTKGATERAPAQVAGDAD